MPVLVFMIGMFVAAISAVFIYGGLGVPPTHEKNWVDHLFWGIIFASLLPLVIENMLLAWKALKQYIADFCKSHIGICH